MGDIVVVDISDPQNPRATGTVDSPDNLKAIEVSGDFAYAVDRSDGMIVYSLADPEHPQEVARLSSLDWCNDIAVCGDYACVATADALRIVDISNPRSPSEAGVYPVNASGYRGQVYDVAASGDCALIACCDSGLYVIDVSDRGQPRRVGAWNSPGMAYRVAVSGTRACLVDYGTTLHVIDFSTPSNPQRTGFYDVPGGGTDIALSGSLACVSARTGGLQIIGDSSLGVTEAGPGAFRSTPAARFVSGDILMMPESGPGRLAGFLLDISGRRVLNLYPGRNDVSRLASGVYRAVSTESHAATPVLTLVRTRKD